MSLYGYPRPTGDLDLWVEPTPENAVRLAEAIREFGFNIPQRSEALFLRPNQIIRMGKPPLRIELLTAISGVEFGECYERRMQITLDETEISVIALDDLRRKKRTAGRPKDIADLDALEGG